MNERIFAFTKRLSLIAFLAYVFCSCNGQAHTKICEEQLSLARRLVFGDTIMKATKMDSALVLVDKSLECAITRKGAVDLKVFILNALEKNPEGMTFVGSLNESDFMYAYKKAAIYKNFLARKYNLENDTLRRDSTYKELASYLENYISNKKVDGKEFEQVYGDLYVVKSNFLDTADYNKEIEVLKQKYPEKSDFFDFFVIHSSADTLTPAQHLSR